MPDSDIACSSDFDDQRHFTEARGRNKKELRNTTCTEFLIVLNATKNQADYSMHQKHILFSAGEECEKEITFWRSAQHVSVRVSLLGLPGTLSRLPGLRRCSSQCFLHQHLGMVSRRAGRALGSATSIGARLSVSAALKFPGQRAHV